MRANTFGLLTSVAICTLAFVGSASGEGTALAQDADAGYEAEISGEGGDAAPLDARSLLAEAKADTRARRLVDAREKVNRALALAVAAQDRDAITEARELIALLVPLIPHVTFERPAGVVNLVLRFDDRPVPVDAMTKKFSVNPGDHHVAAEGTREGKAVAYEGDIHVEETETLSIALPMTVAPDYTGNPPGFREPDHACLLAAKTQDDVQACIEGKKSHGCGACLIAPAAPAPLALVVLPLVAIARRARRRR